VPLLRDSLRDLEAEIRRSGQPDLPHTRQALSRAYVAIQVLHLQSIRQVSLREAGAPAGADGPATKLLWAHADQVLGHAWLETIGAPALWGADAGRAITEYFYSRPSSVYGGSGQIQRNLLAQRFMAMPKPESR